MIARLLADPAIKRALGRVDPVRLLKQAIAVQQIPAPTFAEANRAAYVAAQFISAGLADVETDDIGNVYGRLPSAGLRAPVLVTAHTDTVFPLDTDLAIRREAGRVYGPGLGDNALGVAALMELPALLQSGDVELPGDLWLVANVGEEGLGDLRGMRRAVDRLGETVGATIVLEGLAFGRIYNSGIGVRRYCVRASAAGGHSWMHFGRPSAVHGLVQLGSALTELQTPAAPRTTLNIGKISGGTSVNTIARTAELELDLRSEDDAILAKLARKVETTIAAVEERSKVKFKFEICGNRPSGQIPTEHPLVQLAVATLQHVGHAEPQLERGSTDANIPLSRGLPAVTVGLTSGGNTHRPDEYIEVGLLQDGLRHIFLLVAGAFSISPELRSSLVEPRAERETKRSPEGAYRDQDLRQNGLRYGVSTGSTPTQPAFWLPTA